MTHRVAPSPADGNRLPGSVTAVIGRARRRGRTPSARRAALGLTTVLAVGGCTAGSTDVAPERPTGTGDADDCVVAAAGDVAGADHRTGAARTADLIARTRPEKVLALGDLAYPDGTAEDFAEYYHPTWGRFRSITAPTPGNHEYHSDGRGYYDYFDVDPHYGFDVCGWRVVSVDQYAGMAEAAAFIEREGAAAGHTPLLVFWHQPRFSSGAHGTDPAMQPLWRAAADAGAEIVLSGHDHDYERFDPLDADGRLRDDGTVQFVSGNGGHGLRRLGPRQPHSAGASAGTPGVLFLTLRADGYDWHYEDVDGAVGDTGTRAVG